ncbi:MAG: hypothetical protein ACI8S6_002578 [Myxococcota bacterium]
MSLLILNMLLIGCNKDAEDSGLDLGEPAEELVLPDMDGIDLPTAFADAIRLATEVSLDAAWRSNLQTLELRHEGCPDLYVGAPQEGDFEADEDYSGVAWNDYCSTPGGLYYGGYVYWDSRLTGEGDKDTAEGRTLQGSREMTANAVVGDNTTVMFEFKGSGSDSLYLAQAKGYSRWVYSSLVEATVTGTAVAEAGDDGGWRTDLYVYATGGDADSLELRGNVFFFEPRIQDRFDSVAVELSFAGPNGAAPDACTAEPTGWMGLRDANAYWYDLVFQPTSVEEGASPDTEYSACDGCGTLYIRGVETVEYGEVCVDFSWLWSEGTVDLPDPTDFITTFREY